MAQNIIVAEMVQSNKSNNLVWFVHVTGCDNPDLQGYCKQALAAIRLAFALKKRSGFNISDNVLQRLREQHSATKPAQQVETTDEVIQDTEEKKTKKQRRRTKRTEKEAE